MSRVPEDVRHSIAEIVKYDFAAEEADYVREDEPEGHVFEHIKRVSDWLSTPTRRSMTDGRPCRDTIDVTVLDWDGAFVLDPCR